MYNPKLYDIITTIIIISYQFIFKDFILNTKEYKTKSFNSIFTLKKIPLIHNPIKNESKKKKVSE